MKKFTFLFFLIISISAFSQAKFDYDSVIQYQNQLNEICSNPETTILKSKDLKTFKSLNFYPINEAFFVNAKFKLTPEEKITKMKTFTSLKVKWIKFGEIYFTLNNKDFKLNVYQRICGTKVEECSNKLFLPFTDLTCGNESYSEGRYVEVEMPFGNNITIDFNKAYNPCAAFNKTCNYCPRVPLENYLQVKIEAGVKKFHD